MSEHVAGKAEKKRGSRFWASIVLFALAGILLAVSIGGYILRGSASTRANLDRMRTSAVLHTATEGLVDNIAQEARSEKLKELRADKNFRKRGLDEVNSICDGAMNEARAEAEKLYSNPEVKDEAALVSVTYKMPNMREGGTLTSYGYKLRFCPECGANIRKRLRKWKNEMRDQSRI